MEVLGEISNFCRFCLSQDTQNLMLLSSAIEGLSFSVQDIQQTTGISILESETVSVSICIKCSNSIELSVDFRRSCLNGNVLFMQLFGHIIEKLRSSDSAVENLENSTYVKGDPLEVEIILQNEPTNEYTYEANDESTLPMEESLELLDEGEDCEDDNNSSEHVADDVCENPIISTGKTQNSKVVTAASYQRMVKSKKRVGESEADKANKPQKRKKSGKARKRLCGICGALIFNMVDHIRSHTKENLLKCPHCPVQMANSANLLRHVHTVHEKIVVKSCEPCGKGFTTNNAYKSHMRTHHNIGEQYQCEICLKIFNHASNRRDHIQRIHTSEMNYECQICQKKFKHTNSLKRHARVHSTNAPYACSHCPKRFKSSCTKRKHEITHSGIQFACTLCTKVYRYKSLLSMHYRKCHPAECSGDSA